MQIRWLVQCGGLGGVLHRCEMIVFGAFSSSCCNPAHGTIYQVARTNIVRGRAPQRGNPMTKKDRISITREFVVFLHQGAQSHCFLHLRRSSSMPLILCYCLSIGTQCEVWHFVLDDANLMILSPAVTWQIYSRISRLAG